MASNNYSHDRVEENTGKVESQNGSDLGAVGGGSQASISLPLPEVMSSGDLQKIADIAPKTQEEHDAIMAKLRSERQKTENRNKILRKELERQMASRSPSTSDSESEYDTSTNSDSSSESDSEKSHHGRKKSHHGHKKSGFYKSAKHVGIKFQVKYPHHHLSSSHYANVPKKFQQLDYPLIVAGECENLQRLNLTEDSVQINHR